jgi:hypothetical protein
MAGLTNERRSSLVASLKLDAGQAEIPVGQLGHDFFPVAEHLRALESEVALIVGDRGAGKTKLRQVLADPKLRASLAARATNLRLPDGEVTWSDGWPLGREGPDPMGFRKFGLAHQDSRDDAAAIWIAYLLRLVAPKLTQAQRTSLGPLVSNADQDPERVLQSFRACSETIGSLDSLDRQLEASNQWLFVAYDELDTLVFEDWTALGVLVRGLVSFWAAYSRRWRRIRPKIFLRSDFYKHHRDIAGADVAKIASNSVQLNWSDRNLYGALIKHILNKTPDLKQYFAASTVFDSDGVLGEIPRLARADEARPFVDRLAGPYMGENRKKGLTLKWMLDHLRDGGGHTNPRLLVWLVEFAAVIEASIPRASGNHLLHHVSVRNALDKVSMQYVEQAQTNEFAWLKGLAKRLQKDRAVPWSRKEIERLISDDFEGSWSSTGARPPGADAREVVENLIDLGILRSRSDAYLDVPDVYLEGLRLKRKGGVAKK